MGVIVYSLCAATAGFCAYLLTRAWRGGRSRLLLWSALCFAGLTLNNIVLVLDKIVFPEIDFSVARASLALVSMSTLLFGLIWDSGT